LAEERRVVEVRVIEVVGERGHGHQARFDVLAVRDQNEHAAGFRDLTEALAESDADGAHGLGSVRVGRDSEDPYREASPQCEASESSLLHLSSQDRPTVVKRTQRATIPSIYRRSVPVTTCRTYTDPRFYETQCKAIRDC